MKNCCGNCNLGGEIRQIRGSIKILCLYTDNWYKENYSCSYWKLYDHTLSKYERSKSAFYAKNKYKEHTQELKDVTTVSLVSIFGSVAIVVVMLLVMIASSCFSRILR